MNLSLYFVADPSVCGGRDIGDVVIAALKGGVTMVQLRNKSGHMPEIYAQAGMLSELCRAADGPFLVNDHIEVAQAVDADGVHLGQGDANPEEARRILGDDAIIGQTAYNEEQIEALSPVVDYIGTGPFYPTKTDKGKPVLGPQEFARLAALSPVPVVGIGGITPENAAPVIESGAAGVAMMRSISEAADPEAAARDLLNSVTLRLDRRVCDDNTKRSFARGEG